MTTSEKDTEQRPKQKRIWATRSEGEFMINAIIDILERISNWNPRCIKKNIRNKDIAGK